MKGFSLPLSPKGRSSLVSPPPWFFGGDGVEVMFNTNVEKFERYLPPPFQISREHPGLICITMVDMTSVSNHDQMHNNPIQSRYKECLIKMRCNLDGVEGWFVPITWVDQDFALFRGHLMGFGKKLGQIQMSYYHRLNPLFRSNDKNLNIKGICHSPEINIQISVIKKKKLKAYPMEGKMFTLKHIPDVVQNQNQKSRLTRNEILELVVDSYIKEEIWTGDEATVEISGKEEISELKPISPIIGYTFSEGFKLLGCKLIKEEILNEDQFSYCNVGTKRD